MRGMAKKQEKTIEVLDLATVKFDILDTWPIAKNSVKEITCIHRMEYIPARSRVQFMEECWRVLEPGGKLTVIVCYWSSTRSVQDPAYEWPPYCEQSFLYFNKSFREQNKLPEINVDFDFTYGYALDPETAVRNTETQMFWAKHYNGAVADIQIALIKRPAVP